MRGCRSLPPVPDTRAVHVMPTRRAALTTPTWPPGDRKDRMTTSSTPVSPSTPSADDVLGVPSMSEHSWRG